MKEPYLNIFCPEHRIKSPVLRGAILSCENGPHALALNFPYDDFWKYCCRCETFSPLENKADWPYDVCSACEREVEDHWYLCDTCLVFTTRPLAEEPRGEFYLPSQGQGPPQPCCPGCEYKPNLKIRGHVCDTLLNMQARVYVMTPREACPLCGEKLYLGTEAAAAAAEALTKLPSEADSPDSGDLNNGSAKAAPARKSFWQRTKRQWYNVPAVVGVLLSVFGIWYAVFAHAFPALSNDLYFQYRKRLRNRPPLMKLAEPVGQKHDIQENQDAVLRAVAVEPDDDAFEYEWTVIRSSAWIEENGKPEATLKTRGIHPVKHPLYVLVQVKAKDVYGAESEVREVELVITTESLSLSNRPPVISDVTCGCSDWEVRAGERVALHASASDPDGDNLIYDWHPSGLIIGTGPDVVLDTSRVSPHVVASVDVSLTVIDGRGGQPPRIERRLNVFSQHALQVPTPATPPADDEVKVKLLPPDEGIWVSVGDKVTLTADTPDGKRDNLMYEWKTSTNEYLKTDKAIYTFTVVGRDAFVDVSVTVTAGRSKGFDSLRLKVRQPAATPTPEPSPQASPTPAGTPQTPPPKPKADDGSAARPSH